MGALIVRKNVGAASCIAMVIALWAGNGYLRHYQAQRFFHHPQGCTLVHPWMRLSSDGSDLRYVRAVELRSHAYFNESRALCLDALQNSQDAQVVRKARAYLESGLPSHELDPVVEQKYHYAVTHHIEAPAQAELLVRQCLQSDPTFFQAKASLAMMQYYKGENTAALALIQDSLKQNPKYARGYYFLSEIYQGHGQSELAAQARAKAAELDPDVFF